MPPRQPTSSERRLAAIMFTDIVGYTAMMGEDEEKALGLVRNSVAIQKPLVSKHNGKWIKEMGDGVIAKFNTALDAVNCAIDIQRASRADFEGELRVGIHLGDITIQNDDVYGDGVNVASRLQEITDPGGIYISESVEMAIQGRGDIEAVHLGQVPLKNINYKVVAYAIQGTGLPVPDKTFETDDKKIPYLPYLVATILVLMGVTAYLVLGENFWSDPKSEITNKSIAVLPFVDMSPERDQEYFGDGVAEEIINRLAQIKDLKVIGRSSSFQFKGQNPDLRDVGQKLGVSTVLEGSVRKSGNQLRITAQLINTSDGSHIWSRNFDREPQDVLKIQDEISQAIAEEMKVSLGLEERKSVNPQLYDQYLRAKTLLSQRGAGVDQSLSLFEKILAVDSTFQPAWTGLGQAWILMPAYSGDKTYLGNYPLCLSNAYEVIQKSIEMNEKDAEGLAAMATIHRLRYNFSEALDFYQKALNLNDKSPVILEDYTQFLLNVGYEKKSLSVARKMIEFDPLSPLYQAVYSRSLILNGYKNKGMSILKNALVSDPTSLVVRFQLTFEYLNRDELDSAMMVVANDHFPRKKTQLDWIRQINAAKDVNLNFDFNVDHRLFYTMIMLDKIDLMFQHLIEISTLKDNAYLKGYDPFYLPQGLTRHSDKFVSDPRMKEVLNNLGLPDFWRKHGWPDRCRPVSDGDFICD